MSDEEAGAPDQTGRAGRASLTADYLKEWAKNALMGVPTVRNARLARPRAGAAFDGDDALLRRYAFQSLELLDRYVGGVAGKSVVEIGAGDTLSSGLALLAAGATRYVDIDRFAGDYAGESAKGWYRAIESAWPRLVPARPWPAPLRAADFPEAYPDLAEVIRLPIEAASTRESFDVVCSFQVGEHISDLQSFAESTRRLLKPGGAALHRVDFGPHDVWSLYQDPLVFLRFSDSVWQRTGSNRGVPNRFRHHEFVAAFEAHGLRVEVVEAEPFDLDASDLAALHPRFRAMPRDSLAVRSAIYVLRPA